MAREFDVNSKDSRGESAVLHVVEEPTDGMDGWFYFRGNGVTVSISAPYGDRLFLGGPLRVGDKVYSQH
ncbi:MAG: hypothetical protein Q8R78_02745, partial [Candidatus Omnitrophota bacterium]|nr:hypothetical protein [Candidatus Omnitrophota bacterium]